MVVEDSVTLVYFDQFERALESYQPKSEDISEDDRCNEEVQQLRKKKPGYTSGPLSLIMTDYALLNLLKKHNQ